jgi:hypothetical protein
MRVSVNQRGYTLSNLTSDELNVVMSLLGKLKSQCFTDSDYNKETDRYFDGGTFIACMDKKTRDNFYGFVDGFWHEYDKIQERLSRTNRGKI